MAWKPGAEEGQHQRDALVDARIDRRQLAQSGHIAWLADEREPPRLRERGVDLLKGRGGGIARAGAGENVVTIA